MWVEDRDAGPGDEPDAAPTRDDAGRADRDERRADRRQLRAAASAGRPAATTTDSAAAGAAAAGGGESHRRTVPRPVVDELEHQAGAQRGGRLAGRLAEAAHAYERDRYQEARRILRPLAEELPESASVQELYGLTLYRMGQWALAARHLEIYRHRSGEYDQHPVLADCYRALRRYADAEALWDDLREASPSAELVAEGRIVEAGCKADQGDLRGAITTLERAARRVDHPADHHLRQWYVLADLYERAGDVPRARDLFARVAAADADAFDVRSRLRALR
ncbi:MAG TPA: hypothetical protein VFP61_15700 [Acidimicrobiales bacterium]|nr:hypothetical protein [Acidimicrobiales bacterium]